MPQTTPGSKLVIELDSSQIKTYLMCPQLYNLAYRKHLRKTWITPQFKKDYSGQGTYVHKLLDCYYNLRALNPSKNSLEHATAALSLFQSLQFRDKLGLPKEFETLVNVRFMQYCIKNSVADYNPIVRNGVPATEVKFSVKIYEDENVVFILIGRIDLLCTVKSHSGYELNAFVDHKTQERKSDLYEWKPQFLCYALATGFNYGGFNYFGLQKEYDEKVTLRRDFNYIPDFKIQSWKKYIIENVYWPIAAMLGSLGHSEDVWEQRLVTCAGPDEKRPCDFIEVCNAETDELKASITRQFYEVVPAWSPWND